MKIRLCVHNKGSEQFMVRYQDQFEGIDLKLKKCAKQCKQCKKQPFAVIDKVPILFDSLDELYEYVRERQK